MLSHGHVPVLAATIAEGLSKLSTTWSQSRAGADHGHRTDPDCAILDLNLPDGPGTELLAQIRAQKIPIPVAVATGSCDARLLDETTRLAPDLLMFKPIDVDVLLQWLA
jgi:DNA-binding NarL/FixJ family response regulator